MDRCICCGRELDYEGTLVCWACAKFGEVGNQHVVIHHPDHQRYCGGCHRDTGHQRQEPCQEAWRDAETPRAYWTLLRRSNLIFKEDYSMNDITKIKVDGNPESSYKIFSKNREFEKRAEFQSDWNQNDDTKPDYVKNRPFYTGDLVETVFVEESTVTFTEDNGFYVGGLESTFSATIGETYKVSWDGAVYECTCVDVKGLPAIGNPSIEGVGSDTGEPFLISATNGEEIVIGTTDTSASHKFSISGFAQEVVKIDKKYLPSTIPFMEDDKIPEKYVPERFPNADDIFGGLLVVSRMESTLAKPYPNKTILYGLTVEAFNAMLNNKESIPRRVVIDNNLATVCFFDDDPRSIYVKWSDCEVYTTFDNPVAGAWVYAFQAKIHEDTDNPGTMVSECAAISLANKKLT